MRDLALDETITAKHGYEHFLHLLADKTRSVGKKNKTNNNDAVNSINATTKDADIRTNNAVILTPGKQQVDADGTKVMTDDTINATTN
jgi:hypothetical protein